VNSNLPATTGPTTSHFCWKAIRRRTHTQRLQHSEGVHAPPCSSSARRFL